MDRPGLRGRRLCQRPASASHITLGRRWGAEFVEVMPTALESGCHSGRGNGYFKIETSRPAREPESCPVSDGWRRSQPRQVKYLNTIVEQDLRRAKRLTGPGLDFGGFWTAQRTLEATMRWR